MEKVMDHSYSRDDVSEEEEQQLTYAMQLASLPMLTMVMKAVVELQVLEIIAKAGPRAQLSSFEIASQLPTSTTQRRNPNAPKMLDRMLQLLASHSILTCSVLPCNHDSLASTRLYGLAPVAKYFIPTEKDVTFGPWLCLGLDMVFMASGDELKAAVVEGGIPFERAHGMHAFEYLGKHPELNEVFNKAMISHTTIVLKKILQSSYKGFEKVQKLVDVGGNLGVALNLITSKYPHIKAFNFDLPHVIQHAPSYPGVEHVGGDMFESVPQGDTIFMKWILHDWSDDRCLDLLKNCHKALPADGKIIVVEAVLPLKPNDSTSTKSILQLDVGMMTQSPGGKERTQREFLALAIGAGFSGIRLECFVSNLWVMEFYK